MIGRSSSLTLPTVILLVQALYCMDREQRVRVINIDNTEFRFKVYVIRRSSVRVPGLLCAHPVVVARSPTRWRCSIAITPRLSV